MASSSSSQSRAGQISEVYICLWDGGISDLLLSDVLHSEDPKVTPCFDGESLMKDIEGMRIMIIVISERFLRSVECLDNLVRVFDQRERGKLIVKPFFFYLDPEKVRAQTGGVGRELAFHEESRGVDPNKVKRWREALSELGSLSGWSFVYSPYETKLVQSNVRDKEVILVERVVKELEAMFAEANRIRLRETVHSPSSVVASPSQSQGGGSSQVYVSFLNYDVPVNFLNCLIREVGQKQIRRHINHDDPGTVKFNHSNVEAIEDSQIAIIVISGDYVHSRQCMKEMERIMECQNRGKLIVGLVLYNLDPWEALGHVRGTRGINPRTKKIFIRAFMEKHYPEWDYDGSCRAEIARRILADVKDMLNNAVDNRWSYDVFLSFRGRDTRNTIISHLYNALLKKGVRTFKDNPKLEPGQRRSELFEALEKSCIAIIMFSENYARSKWCLDELKLIMDLKEENKLTIIPIFYRVTPEEVRLHRKDNGEKGCYQIALEEMEAKYDPEMVKSWKKALWKGGNLIGFSLTEGNDEGNCVNEITKKVMKVLNRVPLKVAQCPIRIDDLLKEVEPLLKIAPHLDNVHILGICGPGGVGKTTLSKAICNDIAHKFDDWCFLSNVRETPLIKLQTRLLRELLSEKDLKVSSVEKGKAMIHCRLSNKRVLVILDDVDKPDQLDALAGGIEWFGKGSRIIITTRDSHVLNSNGVQCRYEVKLLDKDESRDLFRYHASGGRPENLDIDPSLIDRFLDYANGLPLALVILGRSLCSRSASDWESLLENLEENPPEDIISVLKISFDGLGTKQQEIFLDIACFFKGWDKDYVLKILACHGFDPTMDTNILVERCLVTIQGGKFQMHDLIEAMGKSIACDLKDDEIPNRIWSYDNFCDILLKDKGRKRRTIKGIVLNLKAKDKEPISPSTFEDFERLRLLIVRNGLAMEGSLCFPNELGWFEWPKYSAPAIDFTSSRKLVGIDLRWSKFTKILGKDFKKLKWLNLYNCKSLEELPNLSGSSNLKELNLTGCKKLSKLDDSIGSLNKLVHLELKDCCNLVEVPSLLRSKDFQTINFSGCSKLDKFPAIKEELLFLMELNLEKTAVKELPDSIGNLVAVKTMNLSSCKELSVIPSSIFKLRALEELLVTGCPKLEMFPRKIRRVSMDDHGFPNLVLLNMQYCNLKDVGFLSDLTCFETLKELNLSVNAFALVPECISKFKSLEHLWLSYCKNLVKLPELPSSVKLHIMGCQNLRSSSSLYLVIREFKRSFLLDLSNCPLLDLHDLDTSLSLKEIRKLQRSAEVIVAKKDFPRWMNFQITDCVSNYTVPLPQGISEDDILGLAVSVTFRVMRSKSGRDLSHEVSLVVCDHKKYPTFDIDQFDGAHTWFLYIPRRPHFEHDMDCVAEMNWSNITLGFEAVGASLEICGVRVVCKNELDEQSFMIQKIELMMDYEYEDEADGKGSHHESDNESGQEEDQSPDSLRLMINPSSRNLKRLRRSM